MTSNSLFVFALLSVGICAAQECSNATLTGPFGYTIKGTVTTEGNRFITNSEVGRVVFDGKGAFTGVAAVTSGGAATVGEFKGEIQVGTDCTATGKVVYPNVTLDFDIGDRQQRLRFRTRGPFGRGDVER
jgi:hypothetical protein